MTLGIIALLFSGVTFGIIDVMLKKVQKPHYVFPITMIRSGITSIGIAVLFLLLPNSVPQSLSWIHQPQNISYNKIPFAALLCGIYAFVILFFMKALKYKSITETVGLNKIGLLIGVLVSVFVYKEPFSSNKIISCILIIAGVIFIEHKLLSHTGQRIVSSKGLIYIIVARVFWSLGLLFVPFIESLGVLLFSSILEGMVFFVSSICYCVDKHWIPISKWDLKSIINPLLLVGILSIVVQIAINISLVSIPIILVAFLNLITPTTALLLSRFYLKEQIDHIQWLGVGLGILGGVVIVW